MKIFLIIFTIIMMALQSDLNDYFWKKCVIYFSQTNEDVEEIGNNDTTGEMGIYEVYSDFTYYAGLVNGILREKGLSFFSLTDKVIRIKTKNGKEFVYDRTNPENASMVIIFYDGIDSIFVSKYVHTDYDIKMIVNKFFNLSIPL